jgi:hypothetical protein
VFLVPDNRCACPTLRPLIAGEPGAAEPDELADHLSDAVSLASDMSAYTDRSTAAASTHTSGSAASTLGGRGGGGKRAKRKGKKGGKIRQGTPEEEQKLCVHVRELAPSARLCEQVRARWRAGLFGIQHSARPDLTTHHERGSACTS